MSHVDGRRHFVWGVVGALCVATRVHAQGAPPAAHEDTAFDVMNVLSDHGLHDLDHENWNLYGQTTYISSWHPSFAAPYTNANGSVNSLLPAPEWSFTDSFTVFLAVRLWPGAEAYFVPEVISERAFSGLHGIGGAIQNFELQKTGSVTPQVYMSRAYIRQNIDLGGKLIEHTSQPTQLGRKVKSRRLVLTLGNFSVLDFFDRSSVAWDPRQTFFNMAFMTYASWDFNADARGYTWGGIAELDWDEWSMRIARTASPQNPNVLPIDFRIWEYYGDQVELQHDHVLFGQPGAVRLLGYRNNVNAGRFADAINTFAHDPTKNAAGCAAAGLYNYGSGNVTAPDLCWVRKENDKIGLGINIEQHVTKDLGVFARWMTSDGQTEVDAYNPADRSFAFGATMKGGLWRRPFDVAGTGVALSWISSIHAQYLAMGGVDGFVGDGHLRQAGEGVTDVFYSYNLLKAIWLTADYQFLWHPGYNAARGPVNIVGGRVHAEF